MKQQPVPFFSGVLGQEALARSLREMAVRGTLPHALLFAGKPGGEAFPLALALARRMLCTSPTPEGDACGVCPSCRRCDTLENPDLTLLFPVVKEGDGKEVVSAMLMPRFRKLLESYPRFTDSEWRDGLKSGNKQLAIMVAEADKLGEDTALKSFTSPRQIFVIWKPEAMRSDAANKLLKLLEEPPEGIYFFGVSDDPNALLPTIRSRFQKVNVLPVEEAELREALERDYGVGEEKAREAAHLSEGNLYRALKLSGYFGEEEAKDRLMEEALEVFECAMRRDPKGYLAKAEALSSEDRTYVVAVTEKLFEVMRELGALKALEEDNPGEDEDFVYLTGELRKRAVPVARQLPYGAFEPLMQTIDDAVKELRQNANVKIVYFDLMIKIVQNLKSR